MYNSNFQYFHAQTKISEQIIAGYSISKYNPNSPVQRCSEKLNNEKRKEMGDGHDFL